MIKRGRILVFQVGHDCCRECRKAQLIAGLSPSHSVVDYVSCFLAAADPNDLNPPFFNKIGNSTADGALVGAHDFCQCFLADYYSILVAHLGYQMMQ